MKVSTVIAPLLSRKHLSIPGNCFCQPILYRDPRFKPDELPGQVYISAMAPHVARTAGFIKNWDLMIDDLKDRSHQTVDRKLLPCGDIEDLPPSSRLLVDAHGSVGYLAHEDEIAR